VCTNLHIEVHTMVMVRTNITLPEETLALIDAVAGPRGRSAYIAEVVVKQVRRDNAIRVIRETAGSLHGSTSWGVTPEETDRVLRGLRDSSARDRMLSGEDA
jgi:hypothetical protein